jgi:hypothetical protein
VSERGDRLRSLVRHAAGRVRDAALGLGPVANARRALRSVAARRMLVRGETVASAVLAGTGARDGTIVLRDGAIALDLAFDDGRSVGATLYPEVVRFAPRGAKEIGFRVEPPEVARDGRIADAVLAIADLVARSLYRVALGAGGDGTRGGAVDREADVIRVDLRTLPSVRALFRSGARGALAEAMGLVAIHVEPGALGLEVGLPIAVR